MTIPQNRTKGFYSITEKYDPNKISQHFRSIGQRLDELEKASGQASSDGETIVINRTIQMSAPIDMGGQPIINPDYATEEYVDDAIETCLALDQTAPQDVENGAPNFVDGIKIAGELLDVDGDIAVHAAFDTDVHGVVSPDVIASDADITAAMDAHKDLDTGVHGAGADVLATDADIATHAALDTGVHGAGANTLATDADIATHAADDDAHHAKYTDAEAVTAAKTVKLDDFTAPDDNTDLNASTSKHGLSPKATAPAAGLLNVLGIANGETAHSDKAIFDNNNPEALGTAGPGTQVVAARRDHVHTLPKLDDMATPDDNTDLNVSVTLHGLCPKAPNDATKFLNGLGAWAVPAGGGGGITVDGTKVYDAAAPNAFTDMDLSAYVGSNVALVFLKVKRGGTASSYYFRTDGEANSVGHAALYNAGTTVTDVVLNNIGYLWVLTDSSGVVEWAANAAQATEVWLEAYIT